MLTSQKITRNNVAKEYSTSKEAIRKGLTKTSLLDPVNPYL